MLVRSLSSLTLAVVAVLFPRTTPVPPPHPVTVTATDFKFAIPHALAAGPTTFTLVNHGQQPHHLYLVQIEGGHTLAELLAALKAGGPPPAWAVDAGGPNAVDPGGTSLPTTVDLAPGTYAALCVIPGPDGIPHVMKGMASAFTVTGSVVRTVALPATRDTITLTDYAFAISRPLGAGAEDVTVRNVGPQSHELVIARLAAGRSAEDVAHWAEHMAGPPPAHFLGGVSNLAPGRSNELALSLPPGRYALLCFVPDARDGKPHVAHGMVRELTVAKR